MKKIIALPFLFITLTMCQPKPADTTETIAVDSVKTDSISSPALVATSFDGTFEYDGGAWENGYLFYRLEIKQTGENLKGTMFLGNYLSKSAAGGYVMPDATMSVEVHGEVQSKTEAIIYLDKIKDSIATDNNSKYPSIDNVFTSDANMDELQTLNIVDGQLVIFINNDTLRWEKK